MKKSVFANCILLCLSLLILAGLPFCELFTITEASSNKIVFAAYKNDISEFSIRFTHSVNKEPVEEFFRIEGRQLLLYKVRFASYGAGMPEFSENHNVSVDSTGVTITGMDTYYDKLPLFVGAVADHQLVNGHKVQPLTRFVSSGSEVFFEIRLLSIMDIISYTAFVRELPPEAK